jgi:hypothetical protein
VARRGRRRDDDLALLCRYRLARDRRFVRYRLRENELVLLRLRLRRLRRFGDDLGLSLNAFGLDALGLYRLRRQKRRSDREWSTARRTARRVRRVEIFATSALDHVIDSGL